MFVPIDDYNSPKLEVHPALVAHTAPEDHNVLAAHSQLAALPLPHQIILALQVQVV
jgi:hypothetical protein